MFNMKIKDKFYDVMIRNKKNNESCNIIFK